MVIKFYEAPGSPPSLTVRACLAYLKVPFESVQVSLEKRDYLSEDFKKKNPNAQIPCIEDDGFFVSESAAILQYLADKYKKDETFYPSNFQQRAKINHLLAFNNTSLYNAMNNFWFLPTFYAYPKLELNKKKMMHFIQVFDNILGQYKGPYAAGSDKVTIADLHLLMSQICFDVLGVDLSPYSNVKKWYEHVQKNEAEILAAAGAEQLKEILKHAVGPLDPAYLPKDHPYHPCSPAEYA